MRLLMFNLATDRDDPVLGFATGWVEALAGRVTEVELITMRAGRHDLPPNVTVRSVGKERGLSEPRRVYEFYRLLGRAWRRGGIDACFSHMMPHFSVLAGPVLRARRVPLVTWYAHPRGTGVLRLAHALSDRVVTSLPSTYPHRSDKLTVIGQGIDTELFHPAGGVEVRPPSILCVGRLSPLKDHATLLEAAVRLRRRRVGEFRLDIVGDPAGPDGARYLEGLRRRVRETGLDSLATMHGGVPHELLPSWYRGAACHVNLSPLGSGDKVALEAMACGRPSLVANRDFGAVLGRHADALLFPSGDADALADRLARLLSLERAARARIGRDLRRSVLDGHGLQRLGDRLIALLRELREGGRGS